MTDATRLPDLAEPRARRCGGRRQRRVLRRPGEPGAAGAGRRAHRVRAQGQGVRRLGDPPPPHPRARLGDRPAGDARGGGRRRRRHRVLHRQLPAAGLRGRRRDRGALRRSTSWSRPTGSRCCRWSDLAGDTANAFAGRLRPPGHPRAADHPPRRRGRPAAGARHRRARPPARRRRTVRPRRAGERRPGHRGQQRVLRPPAPADRPRPGPERWARAGRPPAAATTATTGCEVPLACEGVVTLAELDTSWFLGNAPGSASLTGVGPRRRGRAAAPHPAAARHPPPVRARAARPA